LIVAVGAPRLATVPAPLRLILKAFLGEKLLFSLGKGKLVSTILTGEDLIFHRALPCS
jgi:hypothetical protein